MRRVTDLLKLHTSSAQWQAGRLLRTSACESPGVLVNMTIPELSSLMEPQRPQVEPKNLITLFKQFLFHKKNLRISELKIVFYIVSSLLKKNKVLASDSDPQELNFDYVLTLTEKYSLTISERKHYEVEARWQTISTIGGLLAESLCTLRQLDSLLLITQRGSTFTKELIKCLRSMGAPQLRHVSCRNWIIRGCMFN